MTFEPRTGRLCDSSLPQIGVNAYAPRPGDSGKDKLDDSAIHPAVVATRGYTMIRDPQQARAAILATGYTIGSNRWSGLAKAREAAATGDALVMPWFTPGDRDVPAAVQFRPMTPLAGADGREQKYAWPARQDVVMDVHPAIPHHWLGDTSVRLVVTEGLLKGDAIVSAMVRASGADLDEAATREQVAQVLEGLDEGMRCVPVAIGGVTQWRNVPGWEVLYRADRDVYIAFDADVRTNRNVWRQARNLFDATVSAHGTPRLIDLTLIGCDGKDGVDDYLARGGTIVDLTQDAVTGELPPAPVGADRTVGEAYVSEDETYCFIHKVSKDGEPVEQVFSRIGGYVEAFEPPYAPTAEQIEAGVIPPASLSRLVDEGDVRIMMIYKDPDGQVRRESMTAPRTVLSNSSPDLSKAGSGVCATKDLEVHPDWPPTPNWWRAVKNHTRINYGTPPTHMAAAVNGWVPGTEGKPVFVLGEDVIGDNPSVRLARQRMDVPLISQYGLSDPGPSWRQEAREVVPSVVSTLLDSGAWTNRGVAAFTLAGAMRPIIPIRPKTTLYLYGQRHSGKTWTATKMVSFWAKHPGGFNSRASGGSANDTQAAMEHALSKIPIWVADDLAPDVSSRASESRESTVGQTIRVVANGSGRNRMTSNLRARTSYNPRALFIVTAEDALKTSSVNDRAISIQFTDGSLSSIEAVDQMFSRSREPMLMTGCVLRWVLEEASATSWEDFVAQCYRWQEQMDAILCERLAERHIDRGKATRFREMAFDVLTPLLMLRQMCTDLGIDDDPRLASLFDQQTMREAIDVVMAALVRRSDAAPGRQAFSALLAALEVGVAHVVGMDGEQPSTIESKGTPLSMALGWRRQRDSTLGPAPQSIAIGYFQPDQEGDDGTVYLISAAAAQAMKRAPESEVPSRHSAEQVFRDMAGEGLLALGGARGDQATFGKKINGQSKRVAAIRLSTILSGGAVGGLDH